MYFRLDLGFGPRLPAPGCVISPGLPRGFGFSTGGLTRASRSVRDFGLVRVLLALLATGALVWGTVYGHAAECIAAVIAAVLVDVLARFARPFKEL
ncbi:hypothetical protein [Streptomyces tauricus]|uniref:hypothetical protein n=1 Tax=Streptomyces tauricus TaxID=68274 RepID=UPI0033A819FD